jgi:DHA1 family multidrug resistance protein-like MFS transporter
VTDVGEAAFWSGLLVGVTPLFSSILAPFWGNLADRFGYKPLVLRALFGISLMVLLLSFAPNVIWAFWLRLIMGMVSGFTPMAMALAIRSGPSDRVGQAVGLTQAAQFFPLAVGPPLGGLLSDRFDVRANFVVASVVTALAGLLLIVLLRDEPRPTRAAPSTEKRSRGRGGMLGLLALPSFAAVLVVLFLAQFTDRSLPPVLPLYLIELGTPRDGLATITGLVISAGAVAASFSSATVGRLAKPERTRRVLPIGLAVGSLVMAALAFAPAWPEVLAVRLALGFVAGATISLTYALGARLAPADRTGAALGVLSGCTGLGGAFSPFLAGVLGSFSLRAVFLTNAGLYLLACLLTLGLLGPAYRVAVAAEARSRER